MARRWPFSSSTGLTVSIGARDQPADLDRLPLQLDLAARDARDVEQIVDQPRQVARLPLDQRALLDEDLLALQAHQVQRRQDRRQRVAQLVPEQRHEFVLGAVGLVRGLAQADLVFVGALLLLLRLLLDRDVVEQDPESIAAARECPHVEPAAQRRDQLLEARRLAGVDDARELAQPHRIHVRRPLAHGPADHVFARAAGLALVRAIELEDLVVDRAPAGVANDLRDGEALVHHLEQRVIERLALAQRRLGARALDAREDALAQLAQELQISPVRHSRGCLSPTASMNFHSPSRWKGTVTKAMIPRRAYAWASVRRSVSVLLTTTVSPARPARS